MIYSHSSSSIQFYTCHLFSSFSENRISLSLFKHSPILGENILRPVQHESNEHVQLPVVVVQTAKERLASTCLRICNTLSALFLPAKWSKQVVWRRVCSATHAFNRSSRARPRDIDNRDQACTFSREMACVPRETMRTWGGGGIYTRNHERVLPSKIVELYVKYIQTTNTTNLSVIVKFVFLIASTLDLIFLKRYKIW